MEFPPVLTRARRNSRDISRAIRNFFAVYINFNLFQGFSQNTQLYTAEVWYGNTSILTESIDTQNTH
jgi:hypothetical protein